MRLGFDESAEAFRAEFLEWLSANRPSAEEMAADPSVSTGHAPAWARRWTRTMFDAGWLVPGWPPELGGRHAGPIETLIYIEELAKARVPRTTNVQGLGIVAPSILDYGTPEQIEQYAMPILRGEATACLGMSEPGAGSDLASLSTRAVRDGDNFVVNGQKVWTSGANYADFCFLFCRTDPDAPKHKGISILLVDMNTPGITVRPLPEIIRPDQPDLNEVFLDDVVVPADHLVGELNNGWVMANGSLAHERGMVWVSAVMGLEEALDRLLQEAPQLMADMSDAERALATDQIVRLVIDTNAARCLGYRGFAKLARGGTAPEQALMKVFASEARQRVALVAAEIEGASAVEVGDPHLDGHLSVDEPQGTWLEQYFHSFANTISAGASEIQRNIIAERGPRSPSRMTSSIAELLVARADDDKVALRTVDGESWTWQQVVDEAASRAAVFADLGDPPHVGVLLDNEPEFVFTLFGAALAGAVVVGINPTRRGDELAADIRHTRCQLVLTDEAHRLMLDGLDLGAARVVLVDSDEWEKELAEHPDAALPRDLPDADALYLLLFTSGSTGAPKAVRMSQGRAARTGATAAVAFTSEDVLYCSMPLFHGNALLANLFPALVAGAQVVLRPRFSASSFLPDVRHFGCTYFNYVGRALSYILATPESESDADNKLKWGLGSEASPRDLKEFRRRFGCPIIEGYSSSEGAVVIQPFGGMPPDALGRPREGTDVAVLDPETGEECPPAQFGEGRALMNADEAIGEIVGRDRLGDFEGYYDNDEANAERSRQGYYWTGDLGYRDDDGTFYFAGRTADWLRVDGENFAAGPVERILGQFPDVASVAVYAVPDPQTGDQVMAALELDADARFDVDAFDQFLAEQPDLSPKWKPRFVRVIDALPLTANGKLDRNPLRREQWDTTDALWWRPSAADPYRRLSDDDRSELRAEFAHHGREAYLP